MRSRPAALIIGVTLAMAACAGPTAPTPAPPGNASASVSDSSAPARQQRTLVVGMGREIDTLGRWGDRTDNETHDIVQAGLVQRNQVVFKEQPWMAEEFPSMEKGTWRVNPDGTMVTTYHLRPNIKWHDGTTVSSKDF